MIEWISIDEEVPHDEDELVLVYMPDPYGHGPLVTTGFYSDNWPNSSWALMFGGHRNDVTHWAHINWP